MEAVLVEDKRAGRDGGTRPPNWYETQFGLKKNDAGNSDILDKTKQADYRLDLWKVLKERILDNKVELSLREVLGIAKKEFHEAIVDLVKRKRLLTELKPEKPVEVRTMHLEDKALEDELVESHYSRLHCSDRGRPRPNGGVD